tara:strand:+ start:348 stop:509 length:162 start_codon:yes stop_codon:yes gene_type:complete
MDLITIWNSLGWIDGALFTVWLGVIFYGKCWLDLLATKNYKDFIRLYRKFMGK